jgi:hypothetical protein
LGCTTLLTRCEEVMDAFRTRWTPTLPSAQRKTLKWEQPIFAAGVLLACCRAAGVSHPHIYTHMCIILIIE